MAVNTTVQVTLPGMGESVREGTILEWHKQEGDSVEADETLVEVSTDKVDAEVPAPVAGTIAEIHAAAGETVSVGQVIARMLTDGSQAPANGAAVAGPAARGPAPATPNGVSPVARRVATVEGVDISSVRGSGPSGRITKA